MTDLVSSAPRGDSPGVGAAPARAGALPPPGGPRLPPWLRRPLPATPVFAEMAGLLAELRLHTVCASARCPNHWECWSRRTATFMIGGDRCTRACRFCAVATAKPRPLDAGEPARVAEATRRLGLRHVVITSVARDDLADGGAGHFAETIAAVRAAGPGIVVEVLTPDFNDCDQALGTLLAATPDVFNHNLETVPRLTPRVRSRATYARSLSVLRKARLGQRDGRFTKSGLMLGLGETAAEVERVMLDLRSVGCDILTLGQYLPPTPRHLPAAAFITPAEFAAFARQARAAGFAHVASGPLVRSSYQADAFDVRVRA